MNKVWKDLVIELVRRLAHNSKIMGSNPGVMSMTVTVVDP